jgi:uncharacterized membrane protein YbhN (UPF0104 family)
MVLLAPAPLRVPPARCPVPAGADRRAPELPEWLAPEHREWSAPEHREWSGPDRQDRTGQPGPSLHLGRWIGGGVLVAALAMLALQLRDAELDAAFAAVDPGGLAAGLGWFALSLVAAAVTVTGFSPLPLRLGTTLLAQLAVGGLRLLVPSAAGMPAVIVRYLTRSGATVADAAATVAAGQAAQLVATAAVVAALGAGSGVGPTAPSARTTVVVLVALAVLALVGGLAARLSTRVRSGLVAVWRGQVALVRHARRNPGKVAAGVLASAALTLFHVLAFAACVSAAGGALPLVTLAAVYLGAATAGSLIPAPGGIGPVEAALVAGLTAAGMPLPAATAAALLSRLVSVWLPALPGLVAAGVLRRRALL